MCRWREWNGAIFPYLEARVPKRTKRTTGREAKIFSVRPDDYELHDLSCSCSNLDAFNQPISRNKGRKKRGITFRLRFSEEKSSTFKIVLDMIRFRKRFVSMVAFRFPFYSPFVFEGFFLTRVIKTEHIIATKILLASKVWYYNQNLRDFHYLV